MRKKASIARKTCVAVLAAAGASNRMRGTNKLFAELGGIPIIAITLQALEECEAIDAIIICAREADLAKITDLCGAYGIKKLEAVIRGGNTRAESVLAGVYRAGEDYDYIAIHDAARPFVTSDMVCETLDAAVKFGAAVPAVAVKDTIKLSDGNTVIKTIERDSLRAVQTPQIFAASLIRSAMSKACEEKVEITDDCSAVERVGINPAVTAGDYFNIKITTPEDLVLANAIYKERIK